MSKDIVQRLIDLSMCADESSPADAAMLVQASEEIERLRLTDEELEAIRGAVGAYNDNDDDEECAKIAATLHGLLKRLGRERQPTQRTKQAPRPRANNQPFPR